MAAPIPDWIHESNLIEGVDEPAEDARGARAWRWLLNQEWSVPTLLALHHKIMRVKLGYWAGRYRTCAVYVGGREGASWLSVPSDVAAWVDRWKDPLTGPSQAWQCRTSHVQFERIHPFRDGNGRTGRMLMNWMRVQAGLEPLCVKSAERWAYYAWFQEPSTGGRDG